MGELDNVIGPFVLVSILNGVMCGVTLTQVFTYYSATENDRKLFRYAVAFLTLIDVLHTAMSSYTVYLFCVTGWGNPAILATSPWSFTYECGLTGFATITVQAFFVYRIWALSHKSFVLPGLISLFSLVSFGFALGATIEIVHLKGDFTKFTVWTYGVIMWLGSAAVADILITAGMIYYLRKNLTDMQKLTSVIDRIIRNTIETNALTMAVCLIATFVFIFGGGTWHVLPQILLQKLYFNSFLVSLNSRKQVAVTHQNGGVSSLGPTYSKKDLETGSRLVHVDITRTIETTEKGLEAEGFEHNVTSARPRSTPGDDLEMNDMENGRRKLTQQGW